MTINIQSHKLLLSAIAATIALGACANGTRSNHAGAKSWPPACSGNCRRDQHLRRRRKPIQTFMFDNTKRLMAPCSTARYDTSTTPPQVTLTLGGQNATLKQTEAWAKGAVYQAGDLIWEAKGHI